MSLHATTPLGHCDLGGLSRKTPYLFISPRKVAMPVHVEDRQVIFLGFFTSAIFSRWEENAKDGAATYLALYRNATS